MKVDILDRQGRVLHQAYALDIDPNPTRAAVLYLVALGRSLANANLSRVDFAGADLRGAYLESADLMYAYLERADLRGAYLRDAWLCEANLHYADFTNADLSGADFTGASVKGAIFNGANLSNTIGMPAAPAVSKDFPSLCPRCNAPAYVGLFEVLHASQTNCPARMP